MVWLFQHTAQFPRHERFRLAKRIDDTMFDFHRHLIDAVRKPDSLSHLKTADQALFLLRTYLRLSMEMRYISNDQYRYCAEKLDEIGKLLGGWLKKAGPSERSE